MRIADEVSPWHLRSQTLLDGIHYLVHENQSPQAEAFLALERVPHTPRDAGLILDGPNFERLEPLVNTLGHSVALSTNLLNCYGSNPGLDDESAARFAKLVVNSHPEGRIGILNLIVDYPAGCVSTQLLTAIRGENGL